MENMRIARSGSGLVVSFIEEISLALASSARDSIAKEMDASDINAVVFDLENISSLNSIGIGLMVATKTNCAKNGKKFYLLSPSEAVLRTLDVVKMRSFFETLKNIEDLKS